MRHDRISKAAACTERGEAANLSRWEAQPGRAVSIPMIVGVDERANRRRTARLAHKARQHAGSKPNMQGDDNVFSRKLRRNGYSIEKRAQ